MRFRSSLLTLCSLVVVLVAPLAAIAKDVGSRSLILATTTSVRDSGLLDALLPAFTEQSGIDVRVIAVGTGAALRMGREGNADLLLTHAPTAEQALVDEGIVVRRTPFMENFFVIAGPADDPAGIADAASPEIALQRIASTGAGWVSRADDSGTHKREKALFRAARLDPEADREGLVRTGSGMGLALQVAGQRRTYVLSDVATFLAFRDRIDLVALSRPDPSLRNVYSVLQLDGDRFARRIHTNEAIELERYLVDPAVQETIGGFGVERFGRALFTPLHPAADGR
ncbi:MAG: substrate-binding domain-containing protein [Myxococcota bacterium]